MKKRMIVLMLALLPGLAARADEVKVLLGMHASKYLFSDEVTSLNRRQKSGMALGAGYVFEINPKMMLEAQLLFNGKGAETELLYAPGLTAAGTYANRAIALPLFFKYRLKPGPTPYAAIGPEFNLILAHKLTLPEQDEIFDVIDNTNKIIFAFNAALGYEFPIGRWGLFAEARYNRWLTSLMKSPGPPVKSESVSFLVGGIYYL